jgi:hypothetical protein
LLLDRWAAAWGAVAGVTMWTVEPSAPLALVVAVVGASSARAVPAILDGRGRLRRATYHLLFPALLLVVSSLTLAVSEAEWLAALAGLAVAATLTPPGRRVLFPDLFLEHAAARRREVEQLAA